MIRITDNKDYSIKPKVSGQVKKSRKRVMLERKKKQVEYIMNNFMYVASKIERAHKQKADRRAKRKYKG